MQADKAQSKTTVDDVISAVHKKSEGRTRYEGQAPYWDELLVAEIEELRTAVDALLAELDRKVREPGFYSSQDATDLARRWRGERANAK